MDDTTEKSLRDEVAGLKAEIAALRGLLVTQAVYGAVRGHCCHGHQPYYLPGGYWGSGCCGQYGLHWHPGGTSWGYSGGLTNVPCSVTASAGVST